MASVNKVILVGNLGQDPEMRYLPSGDAVATISLATTERWTNKAGDKEESTEWHRCVAFGKRAEVIGEHVKKGDPLYVEGKIKTKKWQDKDGHDRYTTEITIDNFQFLGSKRDKPAGDERPAAGAKDYATATGADSARRAAAPRPKQPAKAGAGFDDLEDDIPF